MKQDASSLINTLYGGPADPAVLPPGLPREEFTSLEGELNGVAHALLKGTQTPKIDLRVHRSTNIGVHLHKIDEDSFLIAWPVGLWARMYTLGRRLWSYHSVVSETKKMITFASSAADDFGCDNVVIPDRVRCIFDEYEVVSEFWSALEYFENENPHDAATDFHVSRLVTIGQLFLLAHEIGHLAFKHHAFVSGMLMPSSTDSPNPIAVVENMLRQGLELEADLYASEVLYKTWKTAATIEGHISRPKMCTGIFSA